MSAARRNMPQISPTIRPISADVTPLPIYNYMPPQLMQNMQLGHYQAKHKGVSPTSHMQLGHYHAKHNWVSPTHATSSLPSQT